MPGYSRTLEPFSKFNCFMDTLTHNRNHQSLNEVVDLGAVGRTDGLELRVQHVVQLEPNVLSVEAHLCKFPGGLHLAHAGPVVALEVRAGSAQGWVWIGDVDVLAEIGSSSRKIADVVAGNDGLHGLAACSSCFSSSRSVGEGAIDVIESDDMPKGLGVDDQALGRIRWNRLAPLVMANISLSAPHADCKSSLGDTEFFADGFNSAHCRIVAALLFIVNSGAVLIFLAAALM